MKTPMMKGLRERFGRGVTLTVVVAGSAAAAYGATRAFTNAGASTRPWTIETEGSFTSWYATGEHLTAYVLVAASCGFSTQAQTMDAIARLPDSLRASEDPHFANVTVVGVAVDHDPGAGMQYFRRLGQGIGGFDQISVGGSWLNDQAARLIWQENLIPAVTPQVLIVARTVDLERYPGHVAVGPYRKILAIWGRTDIIDWVNSGTPLPSP